MDSKVSSKDNSVEVVNTISDDDRLLAKLGYKSEFRRAFSVSNVFGLPLTSR